MTRGVALGLYDCEKCAREWGGCENKFKADPGYPIYCKRQKSMIKRRTSPRKEWYDRSG